MFNETFTNLLNVVLAGALVYVSYMAMSKLTGKVRTLVSMVVIAGVVLGVAELLDWLQVFPDGTYMADLLYEKELVVSAVLLYGVWQLKGKK